jgi:endonuclease/exonuclease/phosphatase family metal-dependent hydrolase
LGIQLLDKLAPLTVTLAALVLVLETSGCASQRSAPLLITPQTTAAPAQNPEKPLNLKLVTYNIWGLPSWMTGARHGRYPQIARELKRLDPDIILLQEAWTANARKSAPDDGHWAIARAAGQHTFFQQSGLVTLSRFPIVGGEFYPFSHAAFPDRFVHKGVLKVSVQLPGGRVLNIWNVHLQDAGSFALRQSQIRELVSHVEAAQDGQIADLVGGDFNCPPDCLLYRELAKEFGPDLQELTGAPPFITWDGMSKKSGTGQTLDHIFIRPRTILQELKPQTHMAFAAQTLEQRLSDHFGIEATVNLTPAPSVAGVARSMRHDSSMNVAESDQFNFDQVTFAAGESP